MIVMVDTGWRDLGRSGSPMLPRGDIAGCEGSHGSWVKKLMYPVTSSVVHFLAGRLQLDVLSPSQCAVQLQGREQRTMSCSHR